MGSPRTVDGSTIVGAMAHGTASSMTRAERFTRSIPAMIEAATPTFSFEFFPPKDDASEAQLWDAIRRLEKVAPSFVSITYGAGGGTRDRTVRLTQRVLDQTSLTPMAHLACRALGRRAAQHRGVVCRRGVRWPAAVTPRAVSASPGWRTEGLDHADQLVRLVRVSATSPSGSQPSPTGIPGRVTSARMPRLIRKEQAGAEFAITQMVFDVDHYLRLRDELVRRGSRLPVVPAIMPITNVRQVVRMAELAGQPMPTAVTDRLDRHGDDAAGCAPRGWRSPRSRRGASSTRERPASTSSR